MHWADGGAGGETGDQRRKRQQNKHKAGTVPFVMTMNDSLVKSIIVPPCNYPHTLLLIVNRR